MPRWETWRPIQTSHPPGFRTAWCEAPSRPTWARLNGALLTTLGLYPRSVAVAEVWMPALNRLDGTAWARARQAMSAQLVDE